MIFVLLLTEIIAEYQVDPAASFFEITRTVAVLSMHSQSHDATIKLGCRLSTGMILVGIFLVYNYMRELHR